MMFNSIQEQLYKIVDSYSDKIAIEYGGKTITYLELDKKSNSIADFIILKGIRKGTFIGILLEDKLELISVMIGILKAGCVFVPMDSNYPLRRLETMLTTTETGYVFVDIFNYDKLSRLYEDKKVEPINISDDFYKKLDFIPYRPEFKYDPDDMIYIYFTSGSTGEPKAIIGKNKSLVHFINWEIETFSINDKFHISQFASPAFDASLRDIFIPLCSGGTICIPPSREVILETGSLANWIDDSKVDLIHCTPSLFKVFNSGLLTGESFKNLKYVLLAGEKISSGELKIWYGIFGERIQLVNLYGPTETTMVKTFYLIRQSDKERKIIPVGKPVKGAKIIILDRDMNVCDVEDIGEIYIRTPYMTLGYYKNPELNKLKFIPNPFSNDPGDIIYRTGDLGRLLPDGNIECLGRIDRQVKIRGIRVELSEIENDLLKFKDIIECAVDFRRGENESKDEYIAAYFVSNRGIEVSELRAYLKTNLPDYMIPSYFIQLDKMPLTPNGKLDYNALPDFRKTTGERHIAPRDEVEKKLADIWCDILDIEEVGIDENFLQIGGHSLNIMSLISRIFHEFNIEIPLGEVFNNATIEHIAKYIKGAEKSIYSLIEPIEEREYYPVSSAQKRLFIINQIEGGNTAYNLPSVMIIESSLNIKRFEEAFKVLVKRHETLRTSFEFIDGEPVQRVHKDVDFKVMYMVSEEDGIKDIVKGFIRPFELSKAPLLRVGLIKLSEYRYIFIYDMHHIICDGTSMNILVNEFINLYKGEELPELRIQYKDFSAWQNGLLITGVIKKQEEYWLDAFKGEIPVLNMPNDYPRPPVQSFEGDSISFETGKELAEGLNRVAGEMGVTLYMVLLAAYNVLLSKYTGQEDIIVGSPVAGRPHADLENIIGMFVNILVMRNYPEHYKTFREFLREVKENSLKAYENQDYQFEELVEKLEIKRDLSRNPLFDNMFVLHNMDNRVREIANFNFSPYEFENRTAKVDITLNVLELRESIGFVLEYCTRLFNKETIKRISEHFINILEQVIEDPDIILSEIEMISEEEKMQILYKFNNTKTEYPRNKTIQELFEEQEEKTPDNIAAAYEGRQLTYEKLNEKSNQLARVLREKGVKPDTMVGIMVERSLEMVIGIIGILKAGGAYLPIDPEYPEERIKYILEDSGIRILLTQQQFLGKVEYEGELINLEDGKVYSGNGANLEKVNTSSDLAYVIYTSGTTGKPKGVMIEHRSVVNILLALHKEYPLLESDAYLLKTTYTFDVSVAELLGWFLGNGKLVILEKGAEKEPKKIIKAIEKYNITHINFVPSMFKVLINTIDKNDMEIINKLKYIFVAGEALVADVVKKFHRLIKEVRFENIYGPTESTIYVTRYSLKDLNDEINVPIGKVLQNIKIYILAPNNNVQPIGIAGELYITGEGLARGYLNKPELTKEKFVPNPFIHGERMYRTGDLARWLPDGNIEFLGRADQQMKIRGFRVEPGEIEYHLLKHGLIKEAAVVAREDGNGNKDLCAYVVSDEKLTVSELRDYLFKELPDYMIPSYFIQLEKMPVTSSGKIDRKALPEPGGSINTGVEYIAPGNGIEAKLVNIWQEVLGIEKVGINYNFFEMGGDSIKAIQVSARMYKYRLSMEVRDIFQYPNISELSKHVRIISREIPQGITKGKVGLTPIQKWFFERNLTDMHHFNQSVMIYNVSGFDEVIIKKVFDKIVEHHDALRMTYKIEGDRVVQYNRQIEGELYSLKVIDFICEKNYIEKIEEEAYNMQCSMDLNSGPLVKLGLFKTAEGDHLLIAIHHLIMDGVSWRIIFEDLGTGYTQCENRREIKLPDKTDSFKEWSEKLQAYADSKKLLNEIEYWEVIERIETAQLPKDNAVKESKLKDSETLSINLSEEETDMLLNKVNQAYNTEINDILLTALGFAVKEWGERDKALISLEGHGREEIIEDINITRTVGWFTALYPVVLDMTLSEDLSYQIKSIKESLRHIPNKGIGYGILEYLTSQDNKKVLKSCLKPEICFNYLGQFDRDIEKEVFKVSNLPTGQTASPNSERQYVFDINGLIVGGRLTLTVNYDKNMYNGDTVWKFVESYKRNLLIIINYCCAREATELTPSDFIYNKFSINELQKVTDLLGNKIKSEKASIKNIYPLTYAQQGILFHSLMDKGMESYFEQIVFNTNGYLDVDLFKQSFDVLLKRYDILRTIFIYEEVEQPLQIILKERKANVYYKDISQLKEIDKELFAGNFIIRDREKGFDLSRDILIRVSILKTGKEAYRIIWSYPHILMDGWCLSIIAKEFFQIYLSIKNHTPMNMKAVYPYIDYIRWLDKQDKEEAISYWVKYLEGYYIEEPSLHKFKNVGRKRRYILGEEKLIIDKALTAGLTDITVNNQVTLNTLFLVIWGILLQKYNNVDDIVFGTIVSGRPPEVDGIEKMLGLFINAVPVRIKCDKMQSFSKLIKEVQKSLLLLKKYEYCSLAEIQPKTALKQDIIDNMIFFENYPIEKEIGNLNNGEDLGFIIKDLETFEHPHYDFNIFIVPESEITVRLSYNALAYEKNFVKEVETHFMEMIKGVVENPDILVEEIDILADYHNVLIANNIQEDKVEFEF